MSEGNFIGWIAAGLTLLTFSARSMSALRTAAMASNICFIAYGAVAELYPVLALHMLLLPCNSFRLWQLTVSAPRSARQRQAGERTS